jgi:hypothetical protein
MIRKIIVIAFVVLALWAAPAAAQYGPDDDVGGAGVDQGGGTAVGGGSLARTGSSASDLVPYGAVMVMVGGLVLVVARRRSATGVI